MRKRAQSKTRASRCSFQRTTKEQPMLQHTVLTRQVKSTRNVKNFSSYSRTSPSGHPYSGKKKLWSWKNVHLIFAFVTFIQGHLYSGDTFCDPKGCPLNRGSTIFKIFFHTFSLSFYCRLLPKIWFVILTSICCTILYKLVLGIWCFIEMML